MLSRIPDWQGAFDAFLWQNQFRAFRYGSWDCCIFVCDAIQAMTGLDVMSGMRNTYGSRREATHAIRSATGASSVRSIVEHVTSRHGMPASPILSAQRGDVCLIKRPHDFSLGLLSMNGREIITTSAKQLVRIPLSFGVRAWRV